MPERQPRWRRAMPRWRVPIAAAATLVAATVVVVSLVGGDGGPSDAGRPADGTTSGQHPPDGAAADATGGADAPDIDTDTDAGSDAAAGTAGADQDGAADGLTGETVPDKELVPAEGSFTAAERTYLRDRVPRGADPAAILELGTEACQRIGYLDRHDRAGAVTALRDGEIPQAEKAVEHLCPEYADLLSEARKGS